MQAGMQVVMITTEAHRWQPMRAGAQCKTRVMMSMQHARVTDAAHVYADERGDYARSRVLFLMRSMPRHSDADARL